MIDKEEVLNRFRNESRYCDEYENTIKLKAFKVGSITMVLFGSTLIFTLSLLPSGDETSRVWDVAITAWMSIMLSLYLGRQYVDYKHSKDTMNLVGLILNCSLCQS